MTIDYLTTAANLSAKQLTGFFEGWPNPPSPETHLKVLRGASHVVLAVDRETKMVVGFVYAVSDGALSAYIPLLEVLPDYRGHGIGEALMNRVLEETEGLYMTDLVCDEKLVPFYEKLSLRPGCAMIRRNYHRQSGVR